MKVIVIDDEGAMHLIMTKMLGKLPDVEIAGCFSDALDYIMKPVSLERIEKSVTRARVIHRFTETAQAEPDSNQVYIYALGGLEVRTAQGSVKWISRKSAELFGYLLLHRGRIVSRARIISEVFGDMPKMRKPISTRPT